MQPHSASRWMHAVDILHEENGVGWVSEFRESRPRALSRRKQWGLLAEIPSSAWGDEGNEIDFATFSLVKGTA